METPRPYQIELWEEAKKRNIIAYLDTGAGKTLVSILLLEDFKADLVPVSKDDIVTLMRDFSKRNISSSDMNGKMLVSGIPLPIQPKKVVFCVPTVPLVNQQAKKIRQNTELIVGEYSGDDTASVSYWDELGFYSERSYRHVLMMTPQLLLNMLRHGFLNLSRDVSLLILDEAHHGLKNHPYSLLMNEFYHTIPAGESRPKVFGMTASPIYQKASTKTASITKLTELQSNLDCAVVTVADRKSLLGFIAKAKELVYEYEVDPLFFATDDVSKKGNSTSALNAFNHYLQLLRAASEASALRAQSLSKNVTHAMEIKEELGALAGALIAKHYWFTFRSARRSDTFVPSTSDAKTTSDIDESFPIPPAGLINRSDLNPKVWALFSLLSERIHQSSTFRRNGRHETDFRAMVFVNRRTTAHGHGGGGASSNKMSSNFQKHLFAKFREGETNLLVVTRVAEEGIDIPACKLIIIFDIFRSNTGYVQSRGRARDLSGSEYIVMAQRNDVGTLDVFSQAKIAELMTRTAAAELAKNPETFFKGQDDNDIIDRLTDLQEAVITSRATVLLSGAEAVLRRYLRRPIDYASVWDSTVQHESFRANDGTSDISLLRLEEYECCKRDQDVFLGVEAGSTSNSTGGKKLYGFAYSTYSRDLSRPIIYGGIKFTRKLARQSAALETIRLLYKVGKLNENLLAPLGEGQKRKGGFSTRQEVRRIVMKKSAELDTETGLLREYDVHQYRKHVPAPFSRGASWDRVLPSVAVETQEFYVTLISIGPQLEQFSRGCNPPVCALRDLCHAPLFPIGPSPACHHHYFFPPDSDCYIGSSSRHEPRRSFCILTKEPVPSKDIPDFVIAPDNIPCKVELFPWTKSDALNSSASSTSSGYGTVTFTSDEVQRLVAFQDQFWQHVLTFQRVNDYELEGTQAVHEVLKEFGNDRYFIIAPMLGFAIPPKLTTLRSRRVDETILPQISIAQIKSASDLPSAAACRWQLDWAVINNVVEKKSVSLFDWIYSIKRRAEALEKKYVKRRRSSLGHEYAGSVSEELESVGILAPACGDDSLPNDLTWDSHSEPSLFEEELCADSSTFPGFIDSARKSSSLEGQYDMSETSSSDGKEGSEENRTDMAEATGDSGKRKRTEDEDSDDLIFDQLFELYSGVKRSENSTSFDLFFDYVSNSKISHENDAVTSDSSIAVVNKLDAVLKQTAVMTPHNSRVYIVERSRPDLTPKSSFASRTGETVTFEEYVKKSGYEVPHESSMLVEAFHCSPLKPYLRPQNFQVGFNIQASLRSPVHLVPDVARVLPFPVELLRLAQVLPSVLYRIEAYTTVDEFRRKLNGSTTSANNGSEGGSNSCDVILKAIGRDPLFDLTNITLVQALTATSVRESYDYERLEFLGDAFLKFAVADDLFRRFPQMNENGLSSTRGGVVSNKSLFTISNRRGYGEFVFVADFEAKYWSPPNWLPSAFVHIMKSDMLQVEACDKEDVDDIEKRKEKKLKAIVERFKEMELRTINEKKLADVLEALIGAAYIDCGTVGAVYFLLRHGLIQQLSALKILGLTEDGHQLQRLKVHRPGEHQNDEFTAARSVGIEELRNLQARRKPALDNFDLDGLEKKINYQFRSPVLAVQAMTHESASLSVSYQRLEFLGDAIIDWILVRYFYHRYSDRSYTPERLSDLRSAATNGETFCRMTLNLGLHEHLVYRNDRMTQELDSYLEYMREPGAAESHPYESLREGPKFVGDVFESIVAAVYLDSGSSVETVWEVFSGPLISFCDVHANPTVVTKSPIRAMHEHFQRYGFMPNDVWYRFGACPEGNFCEIYLLYVLVARMTGNSRVVCKRLAAAAAVTWIHGHEDEMEELLQISKTNAGVIWSEEHLNRDQQVAMSADGGRAKREMSKVSDVQPPGTSVAPVIGGEEPLPSKEEAENGDLEMDIDAFQSQIEFDSETPLSEDRRESLKGFIDAIDSLGLL